MNDFDAPHDPPAGDPQVLFCQVGDWRDWSRNGQLITKSSGTKAVSNLYHLKSMWWTGLAFCPSHLHYLLFTSSVSLYSLVSGGECFWRGWKFQPLLLVIVRSLKQIHEENCYHKLLTAAILILMWLVGQIFLVYLMESLSRIWCLYHQMHDFSASRPTIHCSCHDAWNIQTISHTQLWESPLCLLLNHIVKAHYHFLHYCNMLRWFFSLVAFTV